MENNFLPRTYKGYQIEFNTWNNNFYFFIKGKTIMVPPDGYQTAVDYIDKLEFPNEFKDKVDELLGSKSNE